MLHTTNMSGSLFDIFEIQIWIEDNSGNSVNICDSTNIDGYTFHGTICTTYNTIYVNFYFMYCTLYILYLYILHLLCSVHWPL